MNIDAFQELVFAEAKEQQLLDFEIYFSKSKSIELSSFDTEVDGFSVNDTQGVSFRCIVNGKMGYSYTEKLSEEEAKFLVSMAIENAKVIEKDDIEIIYGEKDEYAELHLYSRELEETPIDEKISFITSLESKTKKSNAAVTHVASTEYFEMYEEVFIKNSKGLQVDYCFNKAGVYVVPVIKDNEKNVIGISFKLANTLDELNGNEIAEESVANALSNIGAKSVPSGLYNIVIENKGMATLLQTFASVFSSDNTQKGLSLLKGKEGEIIANSNVSIIDNPHLDEGMKTVPFDSEGVSTFKKYVVDKGVLATLLYNLKTGKKDYKKSTGNGFKADYKSSVSVLPTNMYIEKGQKSFEQLVKEVENGLIITDFSGTHSGANAQTGDFSLQSKGYLIENGKKTRAVEQITVSGNFFDLLKKIEDIGNDLEFGFPYGGYFGSPSVLVKQVSVAGE